MFEGSHVPLGTFQQSHCMLESSGKWSPYGKNISFRPISRKAIRVKSTRRSQGRRSSIGSSETVRKTSCSKWNFFSLRTRSAGPKETKTIGRGPPKGIVGLFLSDKAPRTIYVERGWKNNWEKRRSGHS